LKYFKVFEISFDGGTEEAFEKTRVGASYGQVLENINRLMRRKEETGSGTVVKMNYVATHLNLHELPAFFDLCGKIGIRDVGVVEVENWLVPGQKGYQDAAQFVREARQARARIQDSILQFSRRFNIIYSPSTRRKKCCLWSISSVYITADGFVTPCCVRTAPEVINFGNIFEETFNNIWNGRRYNNFRKTRIIDLPNPICDHCPD
jgi:radical SAM protein with 4Fe4S-binding SPASM domain